MESFRGWVGAAIRDGLKYSTINTYSAYLTAVVLPDLTLSERASWRLIRQLIKAAAADEDGGGAVAATSAEVCLVLPRLSLLDRQTVALITYTGARLADIRRLRRKQIRISVNRIQVQVRLSKNRRKRSLRRILKVHDVATMVGLSLDGSLEEPLGEGVDPEDRPFVHQTVAHINARLKTICAELSLPKLTTYSFRKFFIQAIIQHYEYDWPRIIATTLHCNMDVVAAHYDSWTIDEQPQ